MSENELRKGELKDEVKVTYKAHYAKIFAPKGEVSNRKFAAEHAGFKEKCALAGVAATKRQASKFRNKKGLAFKGPPKN